MPNPCLSLCTAPERVNFCPKTIGSNLNDASGSLINRQLRPSSLWPWQCSADFFASESSPTQRCHADLNMPRTDHDSNYKPLVGIITFKALNALSGHSRELSHRNRRQSFDSYSIARNANLQRRESVGYLPVQEPTSHRRKRCLTPPPFGKATLQENQLNEQTQSPLFKLPEELLLAIYEEVIGRNLLHIVRRTNQFQLGHIVCKTNVPRSQEACVENKCRGLKLPTGVHAKTGRGDGGLIQLLQSCRKM
jgi:hypothetical protein